MGGSHPAAPNRQRTIVDPGDAQLLESLDGPHDVNQRIHSANLVQRDLVRRQPVNSPFGFAQQLERTHRPLSHPGRQPGSFHDGDQLADVAMGPVRVVPLYDAQASSSAVLMMSRGSSRRPSGRHTSTLVALTPQRSTVEIWTVTSGKPRRVGSDRSHSGRCTRRQERAQQHVAADTGNRIQDGKASIRHRLTI